MKININKSREFYILGKHPVLEIFKNKSIRLIKIYIQKQNLKYFDKSNTKIEIVEKNFFKKITINQDYVHQGFAAKVYDYSHDINQIFNLDTNILALDAINDPRNLGAIFRNCLAFNIKDIIVEKKYYAFDSIAMHLASSGATEHLRIYEVSNINNIIKILRKKNFWIYGLDANSNERLETFKMTSKKNVFILGNEGHVIQLNTKKLCDNILSISINKKLDSLNVSSTSAILLYELKKKTAQN